MHCHNIVDGTCAQKEFFKQIFVKYQNLLPKFCKLIYFEPFLKHSLVTTVFDLETKILVCVLKIQKIKHAEKMVKIHQMVFIKLNFEIIPKTHFQVFAKSFSQAMDEVGNFFLPISKSLVLGMPGMGCYTSNCEKSQNHCTLLCICADTEPKQFPFHPKHKPRREGGLRQINT
jgi:hypothetical protein